jgi:DMSO/TMAO reductase YedYZ molybdopterin-dependent catalytic subunit
MSLSRRDLLRAVPLAAAAPLLAGRPAAGRARQLAAGEGMIVRQQEPRNLETPLRDLRPDLPTEKFYVRSHFAVPAVDPKTYTLTVEGHVEKKLELTLDDLKKMEAVTREIVLECAGNGRVFLVPQARGLQWGHGAVGSAKWTGVPLGAVLDRAGVKAGAVDVVLTGADTGAITTDPPSPGAINFDRGIPFAKARKDETLLAWNMNDEPLTASHGAPLRAIVGGWYGMASVKWLTRIVVLDRPRAGFWQTMDYAVWERGADGLPQLVPVTAVQPKAILTTFGPGEVLKAGGEYTLGGMAWAGENGVKRVEFSTDGGKTWAPTHGGEAKPFAWGRWSVAFKAPAAPGPLGILARCTDDKGNTQPEKRDPDRRSYAINHLVPVEVLVK